MVSGVAKEDLMRMMYPVALIALTGAIACLPTVRTDFDPEVSFTAFNSYAWAESTSTRRSELEDANPFLERRLRRAVDYVLEQRGYRAVAPGITPDFLVTAFVVGPSRNEAPWRLWAVNRCIGDPRVGVVIGYPFGYGPHMPWYRYHGFYRWDPWGYACSYRLGFGYVWIPVYQQPSDRMPGTLVVDVMEPASGELIWRGWAEGALLDREVVRSQEQLDEVVARILSKFPPEGSAR
jgi:hypothetical protein